MNGLDLFSGIGGLSLALEPWVQTVAYCEIDTKAQTELIARIEDGSLAKAPIWDDVRTLKAEHLPPIDIIVAGFPCQDISTAGNGGGLAGERSGLFFEVVRLTEELRPSFVFLENVAAIRTRGLREVVRAFTDLGYDCRWTCLSASEVGTPHSRKRWFLLAHSNSERELQQEGTLESVGRRTSDRYPKGWIPLPNQGVSLLVNGVPASVGDQKLFGNAVVPAQAREAFKRLIGMEES